MRNKSYKKYARTKQHMILHIAIYVLLLYFSFPQSVWWTKTHFCIKYISHITQVLMQWYWCIERFSFRASTRLIGGGEAWNLFVVAAEYLRGNNSGDISVVLGVEVRSFPAVITEAPLDPRHIWKCCIFHLFSKADPLSNLCGLRLPYRLIHHGWFSFDCRYMVELRMVQRDGAKSKGTRFELLKYLFCPINRAIPLSIFIWRKKRRR